MSKKKKVVIGLLAVAGLAGSWVLISGALFSPEEAPQFRTETVRRETVSVSISSAGYIGPKRLVEVKSKASGEILKIHVRDGDKVNKGDLLVELDKTEERTRVRQAEADVMATQARLAQAQVKLEEARRNYSHMALLLEEKLITGEEALKAKSQLSLAETDVKISRASLVTSEEQLKNARVRFADTEIRAPITGTVLEKFVEEGQIIASGISSTTGGTALMTIGDMSSIISTAEIDEVDIGRLKVGQTALVNVDAYPNRAFKGELVHIAPKGIDQSNVTVFNIEINITDPDKQLLKAGMTNTATILVEERQNVLTLPSYAVQFRQGRHMVLVAKHGAKEPEPKPVKVGLNDYERIEVVSGLAEGDTVLVPVAGGFSGPREGREGMRGGAAANGTSPDRNTMRAMRRLGR